MKSLAKPSLYVAAGVALWAGCSTRPTATDYDWSDRTEYRTLSTVPNNGEYLASGGMEIAGDYFLMYNSSQPTLFDCYRLRNDSLRFVAHVQRRGKGPYEAIFSRAVYRPECRKLYLVDQQSREKAYAVSLDDPDDLTDVGSWQTLELPATGALFSIIPTDCSGGFAAQTIDDKEHMFGIFRAGDSTVAPIPIPYPEVGTSCSAHSLGVAFIGTLVKQPGGRKYAFSAQNARYVLLFGLNGDKPEQATRIYETLPEFKMAADGINIQRSADVLSGFYIQATEKFIYLTPRNHKDNDAAALTGHPPFGTSYETLVFDWEGRPVKKILFDKPAQCITVDNENRYLYATYADTGSLTEYVVRTEL